jgi:hypothetical protein
MLYPTGEQKPPQHHQEITKAAQNRLTTLAIGRQSRDESISKTMTI